MSNYFEAVSTIQYGLFLLKKIEEENNNRTIIEMLIDNNTGYDLEKYKGIKIIIQDIKNAKLSINEPVDRENIILDKIEEIFNNLKHYFFSKKTLHALPTYSMCYVISY